MRDGTTTLLLFMIFIAVAFPGSYSGLGPAMLLGLGIAIVWGVAWVAYHVVTFTWEEFWKASTLAKCMVALGVPFACSLLVFLAVAIPGMLGFEYLTRETITMVLWWSGGVCLATMLPFGILSAKHDELESIRIAKAHAEFQEKYGNR